MKKALFIFCCTSMIVFAQAAEVVIPLGGNTYRTKGITGSVTSAGLSNWTSTETVFSVFFRINRPGNLVLSLRYKMPANTSRIAFTCTAGTTVRRFYVSLPPGNRDIETTVFIGELSDCQSGYIRLDMQGIEKQGGNVFATPVAIVADGSAAREISFVQNNDGNMFYWGRRGPSVHLWYSMTGITDAEYFYNEVTVPAGMDTLGSYFMANGFSEGYFGMQVNSATERHVLFSVWSPFATDDPSRIPDDQKIRLLQKGDGVYTGEFGGEGSGGQSYLVYPWKAGVGYRFLTRVRPADGGYSEYTAWFYPPEEGRWRLIAQFSRPATRTYYTGAYSFVENFNPETGHITRKVYFNNQWFRTVDGIWHEVQKATFTADDTGRKRFRLDYTGGADTAGFFLQNCGFFDTYLAPDTQLQRNGTHEAPADLNFIAEF
jgi:hypothetical protein